MMSDIDKAVLAKLMDSALDSTYAFRVAVNVLVDYLIKLAIGDNAWLGAFAIHMGFGDKITPFHNGDKWCYIEDLIPKGLCV